MESYRHSYVLVVLLIACIWHTPGVAQLPSYHVQFFDESIGIRTGNYQRMELAKDHDNFLWILQTTTVQRFDGKRVTDFSFNENLTSILCDEHGIIWVASKIKLYRFDSRKKRFDPVFSAASKVYIGKVFQFQDSLVWLHTTAGFFEFDAQHQVFKKMLEDVPESHNISGRDFAWFKNVLFFHHFDTLYSYNIKTKQKKHCQSSLEWRFFH